MYWTWAETHQHIPIAMLPHMSACTQESIKGETMAMERAACVKLDYHQAGRMIINLSKLNFAE